MTPKILNPISSFQENSKFLKSLQQLTSSIDEGVIITDEKQKILWVNKAFEKICGASLEELTGKNPNLLQGIDTNKDTVIKIREALEKGEGVEAELLNYKPDKTSYWIKINITALKNDKGIVTNFVAFEHDITHEKNTERELAETEKIYKELFELNPCVMWICDIKDFSFLEVNQAAIEKYGYSREEFLQMSLSDIKPAEDHKMLLNTFANEKETYKDRGVMKHFKKSGDAILVEVKTNRIKYNGKNCSLATLNDVTDKLKKEAEIEKLHKQLKNRVEFIENVSDNIPGALFQSVCYPDGTEKLIYATEGFTEFWGVSLNEGLNDSSLRYKAIHPDDLEKSTEAFLISINNLTKLDNKYRYINYNTGKIIWARITAVPEKQPDGTIILTGVVMNVDDTERNYTELEKSNQRYEYVSKAANELIWDLDLVTNIISFGGNYKEMFGYSYPDDQIELSKIMHYIHEDDAERVEKHIAEVLSDKTKEYSENSYRVIKKDGSVVYAHDRGYIIRNKETYEPIRFVGVIQDITQRRKDEDAILEQMRKVNIVIESITDVFYVIDKNYDLLFANTAMEKLSGYESYELIGKNIWKIFGGVNLSLPKKYFKQAFKENAAQEFEMDYHERTFEVHLQPSEIGLVVSGKDVTEKKKHEKEIQRNAKFILEISDSISGFVFQAEYNTEGVAKVNYVSKKASDYLVITLEEALKDESKILDFIHPDDIEFTKVQSRKMIKELTPTNFKLRYIDKGTSEIKWLKASAIPTRLKNGNTIVNGIIIDITEIENSYKELEEANKRYEFLTEATHETIWEADIVNHQMTLGGGYKEMFGVEYYDNKMSYEQWKKFVHPEDLDRAIKSLQDVLDDSLQNYCELNYRLIRPDGSQIDVLEKAYIIYDARTNTAVKIIGSTQDVTAMKKIQNEKDSLIKDLLKRNKALEQFTFMVSHNLRAPIANMMGIHDILEDKDLDNSTRDELNTLNKLSLLRLDEVIKDMNEILSVKKSLDEDKTMVEFETVLKEIKDVIFSIIKNTKIEIISDFTKAKSIYTIKSYIYSIFQNLITNSIKYRQDGSSFIKIRSYQDDEYIHLIFEDDGLGIDLLKNRNKIFKLYNRFHMEKEGKGIGLFMVRSQIEDLNGEIEVESTVNVGTKFLIKLKK